MAVTAPGAQVEAQAIRLGLEAAMEATEMEAPAKDPTTLEGAEGAALTEEAAALAAREPRERRQGLEMLAQ